VQAPHRRSRNDQVALDLRLYVKEEIGEVSLRLRNLQTTLLDLAQNMSILSCGLTHLQRASIFFAHYLLAQLEAFERTRIAWAIV